MKKPKCLYCGKTIIGIVHFKSDCCGNGMCDECFDSLQGTDEQWQIDLIDDQEDFDSIKKEYQNADYLCFDCKHIWEEKRKYILIFRKISKLIK